MGLDRLDQHVRSLYVHNQADDIIAINQWDGGTVPFFHYTWWRDGYIYRFREDLPADLRDEFRAMFASEDLSRDCFSAPRHAEACAQHLATFGQINTTWHGLAFYRMEPLTLSVQPTKSIGADAESMLNGDLAPWRPDLEHRSPFVVALEDSEAAAVCASVRITDAAHQAGLETKPSQRRRGYGSAAVRRWTNEVLDLGALPIYSTSRQNLASQKLAKALGYQLFAYDFYIA